MIAGVSCADDVLNKCTKCVEQTTGDEDEFCGGPVAVEAFEKALEDTPSSNWQCTRQ